jgi:hypothetical protein
LTTTRSPRGTTRAAVAEALAGAFFAAGRDFVAVAIVSFLL